MIGFKSIHIQNPTQAGDTMLHGNDTVLLLYSAIGISDPVHQDNDVLILSPPFPNPFNGTTNIGFSLAQQEQVSLGLHDLWGREVARFEELFPVGELEFKATIKEDDTVQFTDLSANSPTKHEP